MEDVFAGHFKEEAQQIKGGPREQRDTKDICCLLLFFLILGGFIGIGIYMIIDQKSNLFSVVDKIFDSNISLRHFKDIFVSYYQVILGAFGVSLLLTIGYIISLRCCPKFTLFLTVILCYAFVIAIVVFMFIYEQYVAGGVLIGLLFVFTILLFCVWRAIDYGIVLLKVSMSFIFERMGVWLAPIWTTFLSLLFLGFFVISLMAIASSYSTNFDNGDPVIKEIAFMSYYGFVGAFMIMFLNYATVFLVATACANWYYSVSNSYCCLGTWRLTIYHIGTITFATMIVALMKVLNFIIGSSASKTEKTNFCGGCCLYVLKCCCTTIEALVNVLNINTVIVVAITGESYLNGAYTAVAILIDNLLSYSVVNAIMSLISIGGAIFAVAIPTLGGVLLVKYVVATSLTNQDLGLVAAAIFLLSLFFIFYLIDLLGIALNSVFIFYCLDKKLNDMGIVVPNVPLEIRALIGSDNPYGSPSAHQLQRRQ